MNTPVVINIMEDEGSECYSTWVVYAGGGYTPDEVEDNIQAYIEGKREVKKELYHERPTKDDVNTWMREVLELFGWTGITATYAAVFA